MILFHKHWSEVLKEDWRYKWFTPRELACPHCGQLKVHTNLLDNLECLRYNYGKPLMVSSCYRCGVHNAKIGGAPLSLHTKGMAADILLNGEDIEVLRKLGVQCGFSGFGLYKSFIHMDIGRPRSWKG